MNAAPGGHGVTADDVRGYIWPSGVGPRVAEPAMMPINPYPWSGAMLHEGRLEGKRGSRLALPASMYRLSRTVSIGPWYYYQAESVGPEVIASTSAPVSLLTLCTHPGGRRA